MPDRKFYRFPMLNNRSPQSLEITKRRQEAWVVALNRIDFFPHNYKYATICDRHFVSGIKLHFVVEMKLMSAQFVGRSAKYNDIDNVDWVPTLNLGYEVIDGRVTAQLTDKLPVPGDSYFWCFRTKIAQLNCSHFQDKKPTKFKMVESRVWLPAPEDVDYQIKMEYPEPTESDDYPPSSEEISEPDEVTNNDECVQRIQNHLPKYSVATQTDERITDLSPDIVYTYRERIAFLEEILKSKNIVVDDFCDNDTETQSMDESESSIASIVVDEFLTVETSADK